MATTTPRTKPVRETPPAARRAPRRAAPAPRHRSGGENDLESLRTALLASIAEHHPEADPEPVN